MSGAEKVAPHNYNWTRLIAFTARKFISQKFKCLFWWFFFASRCLIENSSRLPYVFALEDFIVFFFPSRGRDFGSFRKGAIDSSKRASFENTRISHILYSAVFEKNALSFGARKKRNLESKRCSCYYPQFCAVIILPNSANGKKKLDRIEVSVSTTRARANKINIFFRTFRIVTGAGHTTFRSPIFIRILF